jgi:hypothetical protein
VKNSEIKLVMEKEDFELTKTQREKIGRMVAVLKNVEAKGAMDEFMDGYLESLQNLLSNESFRFTILDDK